MTSFEFVIILMSILFSIAIAHMLQSLADLVRAGRRVRASGLHGVWMLAVFISVIANWMSTWELRGVKVWTIDYLMLLTFAVLVQYFACVLVSPNVKQEGPIDLVAFHRDQGRYYLLAFGLLNAVSIPLNVVTARMFGVAEWSSQNLVQGPAALLTIAAIFLKPRWAQWGAALVVLCLSIVYLVEFQGPIR